MGSSSINLKCALRCFYEEPTNDCLLTYELSAEFDIFSHPPVPSDPSTWWKQLTSLPTPTMWSHGPPGPPPKQAWQKNKFNGPHLTTPVYERSATGGMRPFSVVSAASEPVMNLMNAMRTTAGVLHPCPVYHQRFEVVPDLQTKEWRPGTRAVSSSGPCFLILYADYLI